jgi:peptide/nickel transport system substrate-binding protein
MKPFNGDYDKLLSSSDHAKIENAISRGATRRELLAMLMAGGMTAAFGGTLIASASRAYADTPKRGGRIKAVGYSSGTSDTLDPAKAALSTDYARCMSFYNGLTRIGSDGTAELELAEAIETDDATTWTVKLRQGVTFHDGKTLTADDVIYSLNRHKDPEVASKAKALADQIAAVRKVSDEELTIELASPNADLPVILGTFHFLIVQDGTQDFTTAIGTGPFTAKEFEPGVRSIAVRNENYWKEGGPYLDEVEFFAIGDESARVNALISGDVDLVGAINPRSVDMIMGYQGFDTVVNPASSYTNLIMRLDMEPGANADFVEAIKHHPLLGTGLGSFEQAFPAFRDGSVRTFVVWDKAHNSYLENMMELGVPMALALFAAIAAIAWLCFSGMRKRQRDQFIPAAALACLRAGAKGAEVLGTQFRPQP